MDGCMQTDVKVIADADTQTDSQTGTSELVNHVEPLVSGRQRCAIW